MPQSGNHTDLFVIGGGVNGVAIARDAAGRGLGVRLAEMGDLAGATSSSSTKLFHGGLRYLDYFEFRLVRHALEERETLLRAMPHIYWPMRFVLPYRGDMRFDSATPASRVLSLAMPWLRGRRPGWMIRLGLLIYDHLGKRSLLPGTETLDLRSAPEGAPLKDGFRKAYEYSDCWVDDSRLVSLSARDARERGADILTRTQVVGATRDADGWSIETECVSTGERQMFRAGTLVNAAGPWVGQMIRGTLGLASRENVRLVRGSHIVTRKLFDHDKAYFLQGTDGRIIFAIPYEGDFTLIGTTDVEHAGDPSVAAASEEEKAYLCRFASQYFDRPVTAEDIVWAFSGVRPLYDDGAKSATAATRDYVLSLDKSAAPLLSVFGGKITTHRKLAEEAVDMIAPGTGQRWTAAVPLPGGDFPVDGVAAQVQALAGAFPFLAPGQALRLVRAYGTDAQAMLAGAARAEDLGQAFGAGLTEAEVRWLMTREFAQTAEDVVWRRSKLGLRLDAARIAALDRWMAAARARDPSMAAAE
jgi:glycerol-3-phosphate dehydrogenase